MEKGSGTSAAAARSALAAETKPARPTANAWLVDRNTHEAYQLFKGDTRIGRSRANNDVTIADPTVSREHILIREEDGYFTLYDRARPPSTLLNGRRVRRPEMLTHGDVIVIGDTELQFTAPTG
ncbi:MAG: FHA domain-containing protein [Anaerolineae bacterium]|nr:FHA domain-containing protein [Anaerolineae bacterium]